jgi:pyridoxamine 5'-phosphate oxidase
VPATTGPLLESSLADDPIAQFDSWFAEAKLVLDMPEAVALATVGRDLTPSARMVLARSWDVRGFVFYTDYRSRKSAELEANPRAAMVFYWDPLGRQVRAEGPVQRVSPDESDRYFAGRPRGSQLAALTSLQSETIDSRDLLHATYAETVSRFEGTEVTRPSWWGGYRLAPEVMEFWQQGENRLHDRLRYRRARGGWRTERLQP